MGFAFFIEFCDVRFGEDVKLEHLFLTYFFGAIVADELREKVISAKFCLVPWWISDDVVKAFFLGAQDFMECDLIVEESVFFA